MSLTDAQSGVRDAPARGRRLVSIDALRGLVMCVMMMDHVREKLYLHSNLTDPMTIEDTSPEVFFSRWLAHFCAPVFVLLTGIAAWLYANPPGGASRSAREFLLKRGALLIALEVTVISFLWVGEMPKVIYLQVIWAIGLSMIVLAFVSGLPRKVILICGLLIVCGHNAMAGIEVPVESGWHSIWTLMLHRGWLFEGASPQWRVTYPALPWIGVILLGWYAGPLFSRKLDSLRRKKVLLALGLLCWLALAVLRGFNIYGENAPWEPQASLVLTVMDFLNYTKYPPSLDFVLMALGGGLLLLSVLEDADNWLVRAMAAIGGAPMFYYIVHLALLAAGYKALVAIFGANYTGPTGLPRFGVPENYYWLVWASTIGMCLLLYYPTKWFGEFKRRTSIGWVKYF